MSFMLGLQAPLRYGAALAAFAAFCFYACDHGSDPTPPVITAPIFTPAFSATAAEVRAFVAKAEGGTHAKLVFIDKTGASGKLTFVDFSAGDSATLRVIAAAKDPEVPVISPDGGWVVYASGAGTEAGSSLLSRSSVYLVKLEEGAQPALIAADSACEPRFVQNPTGAAAGAGKLTVVYSTHCPDLGWEGLGRTMETTVDVSGSAPVTETPKVLFASGSYTGGLSWDGRYLCGGGGHVAMLDLTSGKTRPDTLSYLGKQSCNASITSSRVFTNNMMYLNFPGTGGVSAPFLNGGKNWDEWQAILISNSAKTLVKGYMNPDTAGMVFPMDTDPKTYSSSKWHHPEWSNHPYFAAATVNVDRHFKDPGGNGYLNTMYQERVYLLNLKDSTYLEVLHPAAMQFRSNGLGGYFWPWLWVEVPDAFQESATWLSPAH